MEWAEVVEKAFLLACQYLREHPPADIMEAGFEDKEVLLIQYWGDTDPKGKLWVQYFLDKVMEEGKQNAGNYNG